jgi:uncharacterized membrane protein YeaQ/YmgE (transglycosylase-associated protein family)
MTVNVTFDVVDMLIFLLVAFIAGTAAASLLVRRGYRSSLFNTILGVLGAFIGQFIFRALDLDLPDIFSRGITLAEIVIAFFGALIVLVILGSFRRL